MKPTEQKLLSAITSYFRYPVSSIGNTSFELDDKILELFELRAAKLTESKAAVTALDNILSYVDATSPQFRLAFQHELTRLGVTDLVEATKLAKEAITEILSEAAPVMEPAND